MYGRFLDVFTTVDSVAPYDGSYEPRLVAVSVLIGILAAFVALSISSRMVAAASRRSRWIWTAAGAVSMGGGIWAMHFIGMLAFSLPCGVDYDPVGTLLSLIPGILASGVALRLISRASHPGPRRLLAGAVLMGAGIGAMHYAGMAAMRPEALMRYQPEMVLLSVVVAVLLAFAALTVRFSLRRYTRSDTLATGVAAVILGIAVSGMHYTAMQAVLFFPAEGVPMAAGVLPATLMALLIAVITILVAGIALVASIAGRQWELASGLKTEITRRKAIEQEAQGGRARLQAIFDAVADAIVTIDRGGRILQWSTGAQRIFGYSQEEAVGAGVTLLMPEPHRSAHAGYVTSFLTTREAKIIGTGRELTAVRKDGTAFPMELTVSEVRNGEEVFFTGIMRDITERKRAEAELVRAREAAEAANLAKSQFLATMSHEIRTPMNGVLGMANLLASTTLNDRQRRLLENVSRSGQALLSIINDILDFAKIEAGRFELSELPFDPREAVAELTDLFSERCTTKGLEFIYFVAEEVPSQLIGDPVSLRQILINLVGNSIKFTERGEILIEVSLGRGEAGAVMLNFTIEDTGIGIEPEQCARIFETFHQVDGSLTRARGGSGLGLSISRQLVELMGGRISVESELGRGTKFTFSARFKPSAEGTELPRAPRHLARPLRALLADANAVSAHVISLYLANWQVEAEVVLSVEEAEAAWRAARDTASAFDVIILDVKGFGAQAVAFAEAVEAAPGKPTDMVLLVGMDSYMTDTRVEALGSAAILPKPVRPSELFNALVAIATEDGQRALMPHFTRRKLQAERPNFAARVLVAEDNPVNQEVATGMLEAMGCRIVTVPNGRAAFRLVAQESFDVILMDCEMPVMDGIEATRRIREIEAMSQSLPDAEQRRRIPIIALTAHALNEVREKCLAAGMDDFLVKPFDDRQLAETLGRWLSSHGPMHVAAPEAVPAAEAAPGIPVIDTSVISGLRALDRKGGPTRVGRAFARFAETAPPLVAAMREQCAGDDTEALWRTAHSLKSSAGALGARLLSQSCADIEAKARGGDLEATRPVVAALDDELAEALRELQALMGETHVPA